VAKGQVSFPESKIIKNCFIITMAQLALVVIEKQLASNADYN
jgi:hypothetical protein